MMNCRISPSHPGLLVSVRSADEARAALDGGADIIDVKEPARGPLGAADSSTITEVVRAVGGRVPVTAAMGELLDMAKSLPNGLRVLVPDGVVVYKLGLAGCRNISNWQGLWRQTIELVAASNATARPVAVAYADWRQADAPEPAEVLDAAIGQRSPAVLVDTWDKASGSLFDYWPAERLARFARQVRSQRLIIVLAGSLAGCDFERAIELAPDFVAVRAAACDAGRNGTVTAENVRKLRKSVHSIRCTSTANSFSLTRSAKIAYSEASRTIKT
jgi:uncharacterized protein (UPF0264 family)